MRIFIITQDDPFYVAENINYLISILPKNIIVTGCLVSKVSPFGKKLNFIKKSFKTFEIFGLSFFLYYSVKYILNKLNKNKSLRYILKKNKIPILTLNKSINFNSSIKKIENFKPDLLVSILGNEIFKKPIINLAPLGCINLHTALLPKYRGLMPTFWVLRNNEKYTGVSVFFVDEGIDSGPIITQKKIKIKNYTHKKLVEKTKKIGMELICDSIVKIKNNNVKLIKNDSSKKSYFKFPTKSDVKVFKSLGKKFF